MMSTMAERFRKELETERLRQIEKLETERLRQTELLRPLVPIQTLPPPNLPADITNLALSGSKFLKALILYKHKNYSQERVAGIMGTSANLIYNVFVKNSISCYQDSVEYYKGKNLDEILRDLIRAEGVHKIHPSIIQAYLSKHGRIKPNTIRPIGKGEPNPFGKPRGESITLGQGVFKKTTKKA